MPKYEVIFTGAVSRYAVEVIDADSEAEANDIAQLMLSTTPLDWEPDDVEEEVYSVTLIEEEVK